MTSSQGLLCAAVLSLLSLSRKKLKDPGGFSVPIAHILD